ncbi:MAG: membrane dipeptidase [Thermomicrobiales bacterium]
MSDLARDVHESSIVIDGLFCHLDEPIPPTPDVPGMMFEHLIAAGVTAFNNTALPDSFPQTMEGALETLYGANLLYDAFSDQVVPVLTTADIALAKATGRVGMILGTQGLACIGEDTRNLWVLYRLGVRIMQLTYNEHNALGSGCMEPNDYGLTRRGQQAIEQIGVFGAVLDLSHVGARTSMDAIAYAKKPPVFSHVAVKHFNAHNRAVSDDHIRAMAEKGGVIGLCPHSIFIEREPGKRPTIEDYIDQIEYVAELVGTDFIGIGTDNFQTDNYFARRGRSSFARTLPTFFGGYSANEKHAEGFSKWRDWPNLTQHLLARGFSADDVSKILGGNFLRVFAQNWDQAS